MLPGLAPFSLLILLVSFISAHSIAQTEARIDSDDVDVSYIYAAVMGTGSYKINGRRITSLRLPFTYTHRKPTADSSGLVWSLPVVMGYDTVSDHRWFKGLLEEDLVTLSVLPGAEYQRPVNENWLLKPFASLGYGRDFANSESIWMGTAGLGTLGVWHHDSGWEVRLGGAVQLAGEYQTKSHHRTSFGLIESGVDLRWPTPILLAGRATNSGVYYLFQHFVPEWEIASLRPRKNEIGTLHEFGISAGLKEPVTILGISFSRVRLGYNWGSGIRGWTFGTEFPF